MNHTWRFFDGMEELYRIDFRMRPNSWVIKHNGKTYIRGRRKIRQLVFGFVKCYDNIDCFCAEKDLDLLMSYTENIEGAFLYLIGIMERLPCNS